MQKLAALRQVVFFMHGRQLWLTKHVQLILHDRILLLGTDVFGGLVGALLIANLYLVGVEQVHFLVGALPTSGVRCLVIL